MNEILNIHFALQQIREAAANMNITGPRIMIVGPQDSGKTSLAKILVNYSARNSQCPILCDIDPNGVPFIACLTAIGTHIIARIYICHGNT